MNRLMGAALTLAAASALAVAPVISASATEAAPFTPHVEVVTWYKAGGTLDNIWPQNLTPITCGGIVQKNDTYHINTPEQQAVYDHITTVAQLNGPQDDAALTPTGYEVIQLPDCVVVPPQPADKVDIKTTHQLLCKPDGFYYTYTTTVTTPYVYDKESNSWIAGQPTSKTDTTKRAATATECPATAPVPPVTPPATPPAHPTPTPKPVSTPSPSPTSTPVAVTSKTTPTTPTAEAATNGSLLAYTGSDSQKTNTGLLTAGGAIATGIALVIIGRLRRRFTN